MWEMTMTSLLLLLWKILTEGGWNFRQFLKVIGSHTETYKSRDNNKIISVHSKNSSDIFTKE